MSDDSLSVLAVMVLKYPGMILPVLAIASCVAVITRDSREAIELQHELNPGVHLCLKWGLASVVYIVYLTTQI